MLQLSKDLFERPRQTHSGLVHLWASWRFKYFEQRKDKDCHNAVSYRYTEQRLNHLLKQHFAWYRVFKSSDGGTAVAVAQH